MLQQYLQYNYTIKNYCTFIAYVFLVKKTFFDWESDICYQYVDAPLSYIH